MVSALWYFMAILATAISHTVQAYSFIVTKILWLFDSSSKSKSRWFYFDVCSSFPKTIWNSLSRKCSLETKWRVLHWQCRIVGAFIHCLQVNRNCKQNKTQNDQPVDLTLNIEFVESWENIRDRLALKIIIKFVVVILHFALHHINFTLLSLRNTRFIVAIVMNAAYEN